MRVSIFLFAFLCIQTFSSAQVHFSQILEGYVLFGPENVSDINTAVADFYLNDLEEASEQLHGFLTENEAKIEKLKEGKAGKKVKRKIVLIESDSEKINKELEFYLEYMALWDTTKNQINQDESLLAFVRNHPEKCLDIQSSVGPLNKTEIKIDISPIQENPIEFIRMKTGNSGTKWVKKKADRNCLSADPNDCLVWCLVEGDGGYAMIDGNLKEKTFEGCPDGFELDEFQMLCQRLNLDVISEKATMLTFSSSHYQNVKIDNWKQVDCQ